MIVQSIRPSACAWSTTCSAAIFVSGYGMPVSRTGSRSVTPSGNAKPKTVIEEKWTKRLAPPRSAASSALRVPWRVGREVDAGDLVALAAVPLGERPPDEPGCSGDVDAHGPGDPGLRARPPGTRRAPVRGCTVMR
jgi:hypothetical protein